LIEGLPEIGIVGRIATCCFIKQLGAKKFAHKCVPKFLFLSVIRPSRAFHNVSCGLCHLHCHRPSKSRSSRYFASEFRNRDCVKTMFVFSVNDSFICING
jgi:predicted ATP-grasp superfamily ATP-dependent carboligase